MKIIPTSTPAPPSTPEEGSVIEPYLSQDEEKEAISKALDDWYQEQLAIVEKLRYRWECEVREKMFRHVYESELYKPKGK